jgi:hypothetical protein
MNKRSIFAFALITVVSLGAFAQAPATGENPQRVSIDTKYTAINSFDNGSNYLDIGAQPPMIITFVGNDGSISVTSAEYNTRDVYIRLVRQPQNMI